jgi:hypothetical protein
VQAELHMGRNMARSKRQKTSAWNAFCWKKRQDKGDNDGTYMPCHSWYSWLIAHGFLVVGPDPQGKEVLQHLVKDHRSEYDQLTSEEQADLIREFDEYKSTRATGFRISMKARVNDVTRTLHAIENEVCWSESAW